MHILYFVQYFPPEKASGLDLVTDMLEGFTQHGWDVDVFIPTPTRGVTDEKRKEYVKKRRETLYNGKITIHRMHLYREGNRMLQRTIRYSIFSLQCLIRGIFFSADAIFTGNGPPTQGIIGGLIHKWTKKKFIFNPQDLFPDSLVIAGQAMEKSKVVKIARKMEKFAYNNADAIITITEDMAENIRAKIENKGKVHIVQNWIDTKKIIPVERLANRLFDDFNLSRDKFYVVYAGNIGMVQGIEVIVDAAENFRRNADVQFIIFGNGSEEESIKKTINEKKLKNILLLPLQPPERVSEVYSLGDVSIISCKVGTGKSGMPSKTWTIMATATPIIASFDLGSELEKIIKEAGCGFCVAAGDFRALCEKILEIKDKPELQRMMANNARKYVEDHASKEYAIDKYVEIIEGVVTGREKCESHVPLE